MVNLAEFLSHCTDREIEILMDPRSGVAACCKYLPTFADLNECLNAERQRREQFRPAHTAYHRFEREPEERLTESDIEHRRRIVVDALGYNPAGDKIHRRETPAFDPIKADDFRSSDDLKTRPRPISGELRKLLERQSYLSPGLMQRTA